MTERARSRVKRKAAERSGRLTPTRLPVSVTDEAKRKFNALVAEWKSTRKPSSSIRDTICQRAYLHIIGMGPTVLPLLLRELQTDPDDWFIALDAVAGRDVAEGQDTFAGAVSTWLSWGRDQGYVD